MKTIKLVLIAAMIGLTSMIFAQSESDPALSRPKPVAVEHIKISIQDAMAMRGLVWAIHEQVSLPMMSDDSDGLYVALVEYNNKIYMVSGTYNQWMHFFGDDGLRRVRHRKS